MQASETSGHAAANAKSKKTKEEEAAGSGPKKATKAKGSKPASKKASSKKAATKRARAPAESKNAAEDEHAYTLQELLDAADYDPLGGIDWGAIRRQREAERKRNGELTWLEEWGEKKISREEEKNAEDHAESLECDGDEDEESDEDEYDSELADFIED